MLPPWCSCMLLDAHHNTVSWKSGQKLIRHHRNGIKKMQKCDPNQELKITFGNHMLYSQFGDVTIPQVKKMHVSQFLVNKGWDKPLLGKEGIDPYGSSKLKSILEPISRARHEYDREFYKSLLKNLATSPSHPTPSLSTKQEPQRDVFFLPASCFSSSDFEDSLMIAKFCHNQTA